jgi:hypothetical protein
MPYINYNGRNGKMCGASKNIHISDFYMGEIEKPAKTTSIIIFLNLLCARTFYPVPSAAIVSCFLIPWFNLLKRKSESQSLGAKTG